MRPSPRAVGVLGLLVAAWLSAGAAPLRDALSGTPRPVDFARDYVAAHARVHLGRGAPPAGEAGNVYAARVGAPRVVLLDGPYFIHPPPALLAVVPLVPLGFAGAAWAWAALSLAALVALAFFLLEAARDERPRSSHVALLAAALLAWPPVLHNFAKGQWSLLLAALVAAGWSALGRGRARGAGALFGLAASLKATPVLLLGWLALRHRRAAGAMAATLAATGLLSLAANGWAPWAAWLADAPRDVAAWQTWTANTVSLNGLVGRLFAGGPYARAVVEAPALARGATIALSLALVAALAAATRRASRADERAVFAGWGALVVLLNPLAWTHTAVLALLPLVLLARRAPVISALVFVGLTIPRETLAALAGPAPVAPLPGLALSLHAGAVLTLYAAALVSARSSTGSAASPP